MGLSQVTPIFLLAIIAASTAFNTLVPHDKEVVYDYKVLVKAGTYFPASFGSVFTLHGKLHVQADQNSTFVKLTDVTHQLYNGPVDHVHEHQAQKQPLPNEVHDLLKVFRIVHDPHGNVVGIVTEADEKEYTRNIKRAIASILQIDTVKAFDKQHKVDHAFVMKENAIYGYTEVNYNVHHVDDDTIEVQKMHYMRDTQHLYLRHVNNREPLPCSAPYEDPIMHDSQRVYTIVHQDGHQIVKHIDARGGLFYYPFEAKSDSQFVNVNQTFELLEMVPVKQRFHVQSEHFTNGLTYYMFDETVDVETVPDLSNGRRVVNYEKLKPVVYELLGVMVRYLNQDHIHTAVPTIKNGQAVNRIQRLLVQFDLQHLEEVNDYLVQQTKDPERLLIFHHLLPVVGTKASMKFIKKLIVQKRVNDEVAVALLQNIPFHILTPTTAVLTEMEDLYKMGEDVNWEVRKAAILAFGSLVHQCHKAKVHQHKVEEVRKQHYEHHEHHEQRVVADHSLEQDFEKYVVEYVNKVRHADDYKVQMVYMYGLYNMKLHSVVRYLKPAITGEWWPSHHLRLLAIWAVGPVIVQDQDLIYETFWPIFSSHQEHPELRIATYTFLMESEPSLSRLMNIQWRMLHEPDEEIYSFHYTFVKSLSQTVEPCKEEFRLKLAHIMKYMRPPRHGVSVAQFSDFKDIQFGFSGGFHNFFFNTNVSQLFVSEQTSQLFRQYHEDSMLYVKIHGHKGSTPKQVSQYTVHKDTHVEVVRIKQQQIYSCYYFDGKNTDPLRVYTDFFAKDKEASLVNDYIHISYDRYHKVFVPTDIGMIAVWDYLMPVVEKTSVDVTKAVADKILNFHIDNRHQTWQHYRHGLSFYNPVVDVWQGINRYQSYDDVLPINLDISFNTQQNSLKLSWKKHDNVEKDVAGLRTHVLQMVFVKDDFNTEVLKKSSPHCEEYAVVTNGKEYRHDYVIEDEEDITFGEKVKVTIFDSGYHISNGTFAESINSVFQPYTKNFDTPLQFIYLFLTNRQYRYLYLPTEGIYGAAIRVEPSHETAVSNIDLSIRVNTETTDEDYSYTAGTKLSTRVTYAVKNKEKSLKTWDMNALIDMNPGHTINSLKMFLTRIVPGQQDYKVCVDGVKKWTQHGVTGHLNVATTQSEDGKCVKDDTVIDITMTGEKSHEQEHEKHLYGTCTYVIPYSVESYKTLNCLYSHTTVRHYTYDIKTTNVPTEFKRTLVKWWDYVKGYNMWYYTFHDEHTENIGENNMRVHVTYPMQGKEVDVDVVTPQYKYELSGVPTQHLQWLNFFIPDSTVYPKMFMFMHETDMVDHCHVHHNVHQLNHEQIVKDSASNDWVLFVGDNKDNPKHGVYVKQLPEHQIAVKVVEDSHVLQLVPQDGGVHQVVLDNQVVTSRQHQIDWVAFKVFEHEVDQPVVVMVQKSGIHVEYNGHEVTIVVPKSSYFWNDYKWQGHCYEH